MSLIPPTLPASYPDWQLAVDNHDLAAKTVHTAELASASKMNFLQFLLLRVVWKTHETKSPTRLPAKVKEWIPRAKELLNGLSSWKTYLSSFRRTDNPEGTFSIARHYQIQAARTKGAIRPESFDTPIAKRTRSHDPDLASKMKDLQLKTPTKKPEEPPQTPTLDSFDDQSVLPEMTPSPPITPAARVPKEFQGDLLVPTKDEQIVNTALAVFLDALTIHFGIINSCSWTMHRKAFVAVFEEAQFEARTDGYLDDGNENPFVLIEVKPIPRAEKASLIQVQEGAQMVSWIKNDASAKLDKPYVSS